MLSSLWVLGVHGLAKGFGTCPETLVEAAWLCNACERICNNLSGSRVKERTAFHQNGVLRICLTTKRLFAGLGWQSIEMPSKIVRTHRALELGPD